jgi:hypothetical protein
LEQREKVQHEESSDLIEIDHAINIALEENNYVTKVIAEGNTKTFHIEACEDESDS